MLFDKNNEITNERILYKTKPNMLFGCKKAIYGAVLLAVVLMISPMAIKFIGEMQVYLISRFNLPLTRYAAIAFFIVILFIIIYIIWQLLGWYSKEYTLTDSRVIIKSGVLSSKKNYMPYSTIQDINASQSIIAKLFGVGSISLFSAYDNNQMELSNISNSSKVEEIIFSHMVNSRNFYGHNAVPQMNPAFDRNFQGEGYLDRNEYYDEFEPITPIGRERDLPRREYEYYPEDLGYNEKRYNEYEYEPYGDDFYGSRERNSIRYEGASDSYSEGGYYNRVRDEYSEGGYYNRVRDEFSQGNVEQHHSNESESYYNDNAEDVSQIQTEDMGESSENVIKRHFDKFKK